MKARTGFVANSSSSSFIIAYRNVEGIMDQIQPEWVRPLVSKMVDMITKGGEKISTLEELDKWFIERYGWRDKTVEQLLEDDSSLQDRYDEMKTAIEKGFAISDVDVDYGDEWGNEFFSDLPERDYNEPVTLIMGDN